MDNTPGHESNEKLQGAYRTSYLIAGYIRQTLTKPEELELDEWIGTSDANEQLFGELTAEKNIASSLEAFDQIDTEQALIDVKQRIHPGIRKRSRRFWQYSVAASIILAVGILFLVQQYGRPKDGTKITNNDILPGSSIAVLTTSSGDHIALNGPLDTSLAGGIRMTEVNGKLEYHFDNSVSITETHTLSVPRKGQYKLVLPEGTMVWLNAESSITYPLDFGPDERKVQVTGETYFKVAKDASKPFRVVSGTVTTEATGTEFNVNAYTNEEATRVTLLEGGVKVSDAKVHVFLSPGEQSASNKNGLTKSPVETSTIISWKDDIFKFRNASLHAIMRQVERWYDADVVFADDIDVHLNATVDRSEPVSKLLSYLEGTGEIKFTIKDKKIEVRKK